MAVTDQTPLNTYTGNGVTTVFAYSFLVLLAGDLAAKVGGTVKTQGVDFTVSGAGVSSGGSVTFTTAPASGARVELYRETALARVTDYQDNGDLLAETVNRDFDRIWLAMQEQGRDIGSTVRAPIGETLAEMPAASTRANRLLAFDGAGAPEQSPFTTTQVASAIAAAYTGMGTADAAAFIAAGAGSVSRTMQDKARDIIHIKDKGAVGNGTTDDTLALVRAAADLMSGDTLDLGGLTLLISHSAATNADAYGKKVMYLDGLEDITIRNGTIKLVNHDIAANGGLMWLWGTNCRRVLVDDIRFDMTFTGVKNSSAAYPFCGAVAFIDTPTGSKTQSQLCGDIAVENCRFKLYHPYGQFALTTVGNDFSGDSNNGYKLYAAFCSGDYLATANANQNRNVTFRGNVFELGHNGYGLWAWAYNNTVFDGNTADSWVSKSSTNAGALSSGGVAMLRYHQWHCSGVAVINNRFRAKPCSERLATGFEGAAIFAFLDTNLTGDYSHGKAVVSGNTVVLGNGDSANSREDFGVYATCFGDVTITGNTFDGSADTSNAYVGRFIYYAAEANSGNGKGSLSIAGNTFGVNSSYINNISIFNGSPISDYQRRLKSLVVSDNISMSQAQYFLDMTAGSSVTYLGVRHSVIESNIIVGTHNTLFDAASTNSRAIRLGANQATDILICRDNIIKDKYYAFDGNAVHASADVLLDNNRIAGVTTYSLGGSLIDNQTKSGSFTPLPQGTSTAGVGTCSVQVGRYQRSGTRCFFELTIVQSSTTGTGNLIINLNDIPYTSKNVNASHSSAVSITQSTLVVGAGKEIGAAVLNNSKTLSLYAMDQAGGAVAAIAMDAAFSATLSGWFEVA